MDEQVATYPITKEDFFRIAIRYLPGIIKICQALEDKPLSLRELSKKTSIKKGIILCDISIVERLNYFYIKWVGLRRYCYLNDMGREFLKYVKKENLLEGK